MRTKQIERLSYFIEKTVDLEASKELVWQNYRKVLLSAGTEEERREALRLSHAFQDLWFLCQVDSTSVATIILGKSEGYINNVKVNELGGAELRENMTESGFALWLGDRQLGIGIDQFIGILQGSY